LTKRAADGSVVKKENLMWTNKMDNSLVEALVDEHEIYNHVNGTFTSQTYANMIAVMSKEFNMSFTKDHLKNRMKTLKSNFGKCYDLFRGTSLSGFFWNSQTKYIEAEEEVWAQFINVRVGFTFDLLFYIFFTINLLIIFRIVYKQANPNAIAFKTKKISNYDYLDMLFSDDRASRSKVETTKEKNARFSKSIEIKIEKVVDVDELMENNEVIEK
jgi:hypothetical protein